MSSLIVVSDTHSGSIQGLCPKKGVPLKGGWYTPNEGQMYVAEAWDYFWNTWVPAFTKKTKWNILFNGDCVEGGDHDHEKISNDRIVQSDAFISAFEPIRDRCKGKILWTQGTPAHVGWSAQEEIRIARLMGAEALGEVWFRVGDALGHALHHIGVTKNEFTAISGELLDVQREAGRWERELPRVVIRSHCHRHSHAAIGSAGGLMHGITTPGWQLKGPYCYRAASARNCTPHVGGVGVKWEKGDLVVDSWFLKVARPKVVQL